MNPVLGIGEIVRINANARTLRRSLRIVNRSPLILRISESSETTRVGHTLIAKKRVVIRDACSR